MMKKLLGLFLCVMLLFFCMLGVAHATLFDRGGGLIYDDVLDITWLQNVNYGAGSAYDDGDLTNDGLMSWVNANAWAETLIFQGYDDWRLPRTLSNIVWLPGEDPPWNAELYYMFYDNLGGVEGSFPGANFTDGNSGEERYFAGLTPDSFWYYITDGVIFDFSYGSDFIPLALPGAPLEFRAWAVRPGDSAPVPEPTTMLLLGSGLIGIAGFRRKFKK